MMMSKPQEAQEDVSPPAFTTPVPQLSSVEDLERRLKLITSASPPAATAPAPPVEVSKPFAVPPPAAPETSVKSGKTALLVSSHCPFWTCLTRLFFCESHMKDIER